MTIHRHPTKDESFVVLRGKVKVATYNDEWNRDSGGEGREV